MVNYICNGCGKIFDKKSKFFTLVQVFINWADYFLPFLSYVAEWSRNKEFKDI